MIATNILFYRLDFTKQATLKVEHKQGFQLWMFASA